MSTSPPWRYLVLPGNESCLMREALQRRPHWQPAADAEPDTDSTTACSSSRSCDYNLWYGGNGQRFNWEQHKPFMQPGCPTPFLLNRLPGNRHIATKSRLATHLQQLQRSAGAPLPWVPPTLLLPGGLPPDHPSYKALHQLQETSPGNQQRAGIQAPPAATTTTTSSSSSKTKGKGSDTATTTSNTSSSSSKGGADAGGSRQQRWSDDTRPAPACKDAGGGSKGEQPSSSGSGPAAATSSASQPAAGPASAPPAGAGAAGAPAAAAAGAGGGSVGFILKPTAANRGRGIALAEGPEAAAAWLSRQAAGSSWVVQRYVPDPLLLPGGRKFDVRCYVLVTPDAKVYLHREAYARTCCAPYTPGDTSDLSGHLTNDAVQKVLGGYQDHEDHCKLSLDQLEAALGGQLDVAGGLWPQVRGAVAALFGALLPHLMAPCAAAGGGAAKGRAGAGAGAGAPAAAAAGGGGAKDGTAAGAAGGAGASAGGGGRCGCCYELFGLDFLVDATGQAYLLEVNSSPALFRAGAYLSDLLPRVIEEVVQKAVDPWFPPGDATSDTGHLGSARGVQQQEGGVEDGEGGGSSSGRSSSSDSSQGVYGRLQGFDLIVDSSRRALQRSSTSIGAAGLKQQGQMQQPRRSLQKQVSAPAASAAAGAGAGAAGVPGGTKRHSFGGVAAAASRRASQEHNRTGADRRTSRAAFVV